MSNDSDTIISGAAKEAKYTGIWPFRKLKKPTTHELILQLMDELFETIGVAIEEIKDSLGELKSCVDKKLSDGAVSKASMDEIKNRFAFTESVVNRLIDNSAPRRRSHDDEEERKPASSATYEERERQRKLKERLLAKKQDNGSSGYGKLDDKAANRN